MKNNMTKILIGLITLLTLSQSLFAKESSAKESSAKEGFDYKSFSRIPVLHDGRIKPLDTFARVHLLAIYGKSSLKGMNATEWLAELLFDQEKAFRRKVFKLRNPEVLKALNIPIDKEGTYHFIDISGGLKDAMDTINELYQRDPKTLAPTQKQLIDLYKKFMRYYELGRSLSLLTPQFNMPSEAIAKVLDIPFDSTLTYLQFIKRQPEFVAFIEKLGKKPRKELTEDDMKAFDLAGRLRFVENDKRAAIFRVIPPQFDTKKGGDWYSPWQTIQRGQGTPNTVALFKLWSTITTHYVLDDAEGFDKASQNILAMSMKMSQGQFDSFKMNLEVIFNKVDLFYKAIAFYILSFLLLSLSGIVWASKLRQAAYGSMIIGLLLQTTGVVLRCVLMSRPPVTTLYESILFVSFIVVLGAVILEKVKKDGTGTFIGAVTGTILLFISFSYQKEGDSLGMLAAVLNTNFWLATHVVTITIGYGCCFVASLLAHTYLFKYILNQSNIFNGKFKGKLSKQLTPLKKNMLGVTLFALFFSVLGTILGGIWADQSWGRFWGWDPKENGAMLICMWLLWVVHGKITGYFKPVLFAVTLSLTSIVVAMAWFGVNLLNVGLHSYGFTDSIAFNLFAFSIIEIVFAATAFIIIKIQEVK